MPLRDHFRPPLRNKRRRDAVHGQWPAKIVRTLFDLLPPGYQAEPKVHLGSPVEIDVAAFETVAPPGKPPRGRRAGGVATLAALAPTFTVEAELSDQDEYEVHIYDESDRTLVAAIEIVSPANKDRPDTRDQFVGKVAALLRQDVCVSIVDPVTARRANLYADLLTRLGRIDPQLAPTPPPLYAVTLRARPSPNRRSRLDAWFYPMAVGDPLPTIPLWLTDDLRVLLPLEPGYEETCRLLRIG